MYSKLNFVDKEKLSNAVFEFFGLNIDNDNSNESTDDNNEKDASIRKSIEEMNAFKITGKIEERFLNEKN